MVGLLAEVKKHATPWFKAEGDLIVLLGRSREELGGSEYLKVMHGLVRGTPPWIDLKLERAVQRCCIRAIQRGVIRSAHDLSEGGLAVALVECCATGTEQSFGAKVTLQEATRADVLLFGESASRIVVSVQEKSLDQLTEIAEKEGAPIRIIGRVGGSRLSIQSMLEIPVEELQSAWREGLEGRLN
jgi:phosphoribosylformylglycinamidine synthase